MNQFDFPRFTRLLRNDALNVARPVTYATLALFGMVVLNYLGNFRVGRVADPPLHVVFFAIYLAGAGLILTSLSFHDMHHPLQRYQYLMLPVSNLERFASRYLLTGPLLILYVVATFSAMDWMANQLVGMWTGATEPLFSPFTPESWMTIKLYLLAHTLMLTGAICFRSFALIKTPLFLLLLLVSIGVVTYLSLRIFFFNAFSWTSFASNESLRLRLMPLFDAVWMNYTVVLGLALWILYVAYRCLKAHEVQSGI